MKSLFERHRAAIRKVQTIVLIAALILMVVLVAITLWKAKNGTVEPFLDRVDCTTPAYAAASDGRYVESYKEGKFQQSVMLMDFVPTGIRICDTDANVLWEMPGKVVCGLFWSPDGRYAAVSYSTEEGGTTVVVDTTDYSEQVLPLPQEAQQKKVWLYGIRWTEEGFLLSWDYGDCESQGTMIWNP